MTEVKAIIFRKNPAPPEVQSGKQAKLFIIREPEALCALHYWLLTRKYNTYIESKDSKGNTLLGLIYDYCLGTQPSNRRMKRGLIVVWNHDLVVPAQKIILNNMAIENPYGSWLHDKTLETLNTVG